MERKTFLFAFLPSPCARNPLIFLLLIIYMFYNLELREIFEYVFFSSQMLDVKDETRHYTLIGRIRMSGDRLITRWFGLHTARSSKFYSLSSGKCYDSVLANYLRD
jgi:hypothetical protein